MKTILAFILLTMLCLNPVYSRNSRHRPSPPHAYSYNQAKGRFEYAYIPNMTPKQRQKIERICLERDKNIYKLNNRQKDIKRELRFLERRPYVNRRQIDRLKDRLYKIDKDISKTRYKAEDKVFSLLTRHQQQVYLAHNNRRHH